ncbi:MAG: hypothetical protein AB1491_09340 [Thermodesulfobacteriota bacterium]
MKLKCPKHPEHKKFLRESYDVQGHRVNVELVDEYGRFPGDLLDLYTGDVTYRYFCVDCQAPAWEENTDSR